MLLRNHRNWEANLTLVREGYENSDSVVDEKPGCKATGYLFVERQRRRGKGREGGRGRGGEGERGRGGEGEGGKYSAIP